MKLRVGIIGYGNLGRSLEELIHYDTRFTLVKIFSERNIEAKFCQVDIPSNISKYKNKIDIIFCCGGSSSNLVNQTKECLKYFNTIDAYDIHKKIPRHISDCNKLAKKYKRVAFCSFGWDPGLFSLMRVLFTSLNKEVYTTWGKGVSQGHSEAVRKIEGVKDGIQFTIPNVDVINKIKRGEEVKKENLHSRECFIVSEGNEKQIEKEIINMPNYFKGFDTKVHFVNEEQMKNIKASYHAGEVFTVNDELNFSVKMQSNPMFTANILLTYAIPLYKFYKNKRYGAFSILDISFSDLDIFLKDLI